MRCQNFSISEPELNSNRIIEVGSNSNGHYRKYADGTLEMWGIAELGQISITGSNGLYYAQGTIPLPYTSLSSVIALMNAYTNGGAWVTGSTGGNGTSNIGYFLRQTIASTTNTIIHYYCFGTWK